MKQYISKYKKIYHVLNCPSNISIPINDIDAWQHNSYYNFAYDKLKLALFQNIPAAPMPILPNKYPIVVKPIINLYNMGLNSYKINDERDFFFYWSHTGFWMEYLDGDHLSYDLIFINGEIKWDICFQGFYLKENNILIHGAFDYWMSCKRELPDSILNWTKLFDKYTGCMNIECIGDKMIECHLRMGDIDHFKDKNILKNIINVYKGKQWKLNRHYIPDVIYLFPIWGNIEIIPFLNKNKILINKFCKNILCFEIDKIGKSNPPGKTRIMMLTADDYNKGLETRNKIINWIDTLS